MIVSPSVHTMIPRRNSFRCHAGNRYHQGVTLPGGKQLWLGVTKVLLASALFLCISFALLNSSVERVAAEIESLEASHGKLVSANNLARDQKERLFSLEAVGGMAGNKLALHVPLLEQYSNL